MTPPRFLGLSPAAATIVLIAVLTGLRFFIAAWLPLVPDEAYYWQWSRHLDASYYSKGPAIAYTIRAGTSLFGDTNLGIRFFSVLLSAGTAWQVFLLARRWYDEVTGLIAVLILSVIPLYAAGAVLMTIDPLSVFFWVWAVNLFLDAVASDRLAAWGWAGFAVGCGFLAKYLSALELVAFVFFLLGSRHRALFGRPGFWAMLNVALFCSLPVWWWNALNGWASARQLIHRGRLDERFTLHLSTLVDFFGLQAMVISPLLFLALLVLAGNLGWKWIRHGTLAQGERLALLLFLSVFLFYLAFAIHLPIEPNWPAASYFALIVVLASRWRTIVELPRGRGFLIAAYLVAWVQCVALYYVRMLPLPTQFNPTSRLLGWPEIAAHLETLRRVQHADVLISDGYKEASILSFYLPGHTFYTEHTWPPATQYDFWPRFPAAPPHRALWITPDTGGGVLEQNFNSVRLVDRIEILDRGHVLRRYAVYLCENR